MNRDAASGKIESLAESAWLTQKERRSYQRELRAAQTADQEAGVVQRARVTGHLRRIEQEALAARREELRTDRAGYLARHRGVNKALREHNLRMRKTREDARAAAQAIQDEPPSLSLPAWQRVAAAVLEELVPLCSEERRGLLLRVTQDPAHARATRDEYTTARHEGSAAEGWAVCCAETAAWASLWGARSASWTSFLSSAADAHGWAAYWAVMATYARTNNEQINRELRASKAKAEARAAAQARHAELVAEAKRADDEAAASQAHVFSASMRSADALSKARAAHLLRVAEDPKGFAPHTFCTGAKLGAWTRALRQLQVWELVQDVGWRWVLTPHGAAVAARLRERIEARAWTERSTAKPDPSGRAAPAVRTTARPASVRRPQTVTRLRTRRPSPVRRSAAPSAGCRAPAGAIGRPVRVRFREGVRRGQKGARAACVARGRDGPRVGGCVGSGGRERITRRGGRRSWERRSSC